MVSPTPNKVNSPFRFRTWDDTLVIENPTLLKWMAENDCEYNHAITPNELTDSASITNRIAKLNTVADYGIPVWLEIETCF